MVTIHPSAVVDPTAELGADVIIGPYCMVEGGVTLGNGTRLESHAVVKRGTIMGENNLIAQGAILGGEPQDRKFNREESFLRIGDNNVFREYVTVSRATGEGKATVVGNDCYLMAYCHLGHNVTLHNGITMANSAQVAGHVTIEDLVTFGGVVGIHQYCRVGKAAMVGAYSRITRDVPPFMLVEGTDQTVHDINAIGLRRLQIGSESRLALHKACKLLYKSQLGLRNSMEIVRREVPLTPEIEYLLAFEERRYGGRNGRGDQR